MHSEQPADSGAEPVKEPVTVGVIFGGRSSEHAISCISAGSVLRALDRSRYRVVPIGITEDGQWVLEQDDPDRLRLNDGILPRVDGTRPRVFLPPDPTVGGIEVDEGGSRRMIPIDVVFPVLHGPWGEDGTIQGLLEMASLPYVGSGVFSSSAAMDKGHMKAVFVAHGIAVGPYVTTTAAALERDRDAEHQRIRDLGLPVFVKPARAGSSVGITKVSRWEDLDAALGEALAHDPRLVIEASIEDAREIECGVLAGPHGPEASVCAEIIVGGDHEFYDFEAKYLDDAAELVVPAKLDDDVSDRARALAIEAFEAMGCEGLARVDSFVTPEGRIILNEVNTMPGFTSISMYPRMWAETGVDYPTLVGRLVEDARARGVGLR